MSYTSRAPHCKHRVMVNRDDVLVPDGVDEKLLRAERMYVSGEKGRERIYLTLSDFYADEYDVSMGPDVPESRKFVEGLVERNSYCHIKVCTIKKADGTVFRKPIVVATNDISFFTTPQQANAPAAMHRVSQVTSRRLAAARAATRKVTQ